ncbi:SusC/RagA family TonB-linked outer membrane protein [Pinibacter aurantiacus]|uniref:TonB-dependent receptor n=1 Tax=Pinibacter aurantiacus TaxID=2851599 RepID=A0A9E2SDQ7_9BACT|nr:TonB-dependent receptor [Pinibacter aurantiacus]MBV4359144.1 TonB-dependent receptor [Pinibacter aurantiacus]
MRKQLIMLLGIVLLSIFSFAQTRQISGKITDEKGNPVFGVSVVVKDTKIGTVTKEDGSFSFSAPATAKTIIISGVGFAEKKAQVGSAPITIVLEKEDKKLDEIVVVGYGTKSVKEVTGSVSKIKGDRIASEPLASLDQALAGKTAGVQIGSSTGTLADRTAIRVRGINSVTASSQPLVVVDGVPQMDVDGGNLNGFNSGNGTRFDPLALINSADIESIEVLKDAGSAVMYGSRASNGVILITTKKGKRGTVKTSIDSKFGFATASKLPSLLDVDQFTTIQNEKVSNRYGQAYGTYPPAKPSDINKDGKDDNTNWLDLLYRTGMTYDNSISFSGGADKLSIYGSARYLKQEGIIINNQLKTGQIRLNLDFVPKTWFKAGLQTSYSRTMNNGVLSDGYIAGVSVSGWMAPPNVSAYNPNGPQGYNLNASGLLDLGNNVPSVKTSPTQTVSLLPSSSYYSNVLAAIKTGRNDNIAQELRANIYGEIQPLKGLKYTSKLGVQYLGNLEDQYTAPFISGLGLTYGGLVQDQNRTWNQWTWQNYINYDKTFGSDHKVGVVVGTEDQYTKYQYWFTGAANFSDPYFTHVIDGAYTNTQPGKTDVLDNTGGNLNSKGLISYFGRANYSYANKYFVEVAVRRDGYSGFGVNNQFGTFPSVSLGWELTKEHFMESIKWVNYMKLRGSYGVVGNSSGIGPYDSRTLYSGKSYTSLNGLGIYQSGNPALQWESAKKMDVGVDMTFLKGRLSATVDYFNNNIDNLLLKAPVIYTVGIPNSSIPYNVGKMYNRGLELTINATPVVAKDFTWTTSFNFTKIKNRVTELIAANKNADIAGAYTYTVASVGRPLGSFWLPTWAGVDPNSGNPMWMAADNTNKIWDFASQSWLNDAGTKVSALGIADYRYTGKSGLPTWYGGWDNTFTYKSFDLGVAVNFSGGNYIYNSTKAGMLANNFANNFGEILNRWQKKGDVTDVAKLYANDNTANSASTRFLEKGDYLRVRTISLGYNLPASVLKRMDIEKFRVFAQVYNPFIITKYSGLDPDVNYISQSATANTSNITLGVDNRGTPQMRVVTLGLNVGF